MAGLCEGGNEPPGSLKASNIMTHSHPLYTSDIEEIKLDGQTSEVGKRDKIQADRHRQGRRQTDDRTNRQRDRLNKWTSRQAASQPTRGQTGLTVLRTVADILAGKTAEHECVVPLHLIPTFKYALVSSVDVERSFSAYKMVLSEKRCSFSMENLEKVLVVYSGSNYGHVQ
ncbi:hypothetical protein ANN_25398 [Periplaneta americana]|uniref:HAT C-terminal dimerisation domain-containing protein n=1 Tax=Periplaneta americana TaxID=6978 RepID=A0ABQ8S1K4_PERAM|nr:hypothetical protein ANN_25398 [Periplaneta americana]